MRKRNKKGNSGLTGLDYIVGAADAAEQHEHAFAWEFRTMVVAAALNDTLGILGHIANRPLKDHEAAAAGVVAAAYGMAMERGDAESASEILMTGLSLVAKWNLYLTTMERPEGALPID